MLLGFVVHRLAALSPLDFPHIYLSGGGGDAADRPASPASKHPSLHQLPLWPARLGLALRTDLGLDPVTPRPHGDTAGLCGNDPSAALRSSISLTHFPSALLIGFLLGTHLRPSNRQDAQEKTAHTSLFVNLFPEDSTEGPEGP